MKNVLRTGSCRPVRIAAALLLVASLLPALTQSAAPRSAPSDASSETMHAAAAYAHLPLAFEENRGQSDATTRFLAHGAGFSLALTPDALLLASSPQHTSDSVASAPAPVRFGFVGANPTPEISSSEPLPGIVNYFIGNDPAKWRTNIPTTGQVRYHDLYPGIDLVVYGNGGGEWEYDVVVAPGADASRFALTLGGVAGMTLDATGGLVIETGSGEVRQRAPVLYQEVGGVRHSVAGGYTLRQDGSVGFAVGEYDRGLPLVIDPVTLVYSTFLGGNNRDFGKGIAVDSGGNVYVTGVTNSTTFPTTPGAFQTTYGGGNYVAFVTKLNPTGTALVYSTYLGGTYLGGNSAGDGYRIAVDSGGNAYITGQAGPTFPTTPGAFRTTFGGGTGDAFVTKLNLSGSALIYSTYLGGNSGDGGNGIAVDSGGNAYITGQTGSTNFPTTPGAFQTTYGGGDYDAFVTKLNPTGSALTYSTYVGGNNSDTGSGIAVDSGGNAYVTGGTGSTNFPTTPGAFRTSLGGTGDAFVTKLNPTGSALAYSTYLGGSGSDYGYDIAVDTGGNAYVTGQTVSTNFPTTPGAFQTTAGGDYDTFVTKLNATGSALTYSTYVGGNNYDTGSGIAVDSGGNAYIVGSTSSANFPTTPGAFQTTYGDFIDAFVTKLNATGSALVYSTYLGGSGQDDGLGIAVDSGGNAYITGETSSGPEFPTTPGAFQSTYGGGVDDAYVTKLNATGTAPPPPTGLHVTGATNNSVTWVWSESDPTAPLIFTVDGVHFYGLAAGTTSFTLYGIAYGSYACFSIAAYNANGASGYTAYSCKNVVPITPYGPHQTAGTTSTGTISWTNYDPYSYEQVYDYSTSTWHQVGVNGTSYTLTGIPAGTYHCAAVQAYNVDYASGYSYACPFATPNAPTGIHAIAQDGTSVTFAWTAPDPYSWYYVYETAPAAGHVVTATSFTTTHLIISGAHAYACIYVAAGGYGGTSSYPYACAWAY